MDAESCAIFHELASRYQTSDTVALEMAAIHLLLHRRLYQRLLEADARRAADETVDAQSRRSGGYVRKRKQSARAWGALSCGTPRRKPRRGSMTSTSGLTTGHPLAPAQEANDGDVR